MLASVTTMMDGLMANNDCVYAFSSVVECIERVIDDCTLEINDHRIQIAAVTTVTRPPMVKQTDMVKCDLVP